MSAAGLRAAEQKMGEAGQPEEAIRGFASAYERLEGGEGLTPSAELEFAGEVPALEDLPAGGEREALAKLVVIKLNGGLATTMGLRGPKSLMEARDGLSFLDFIIGQTHVLRRAHGIQLPLVLMNSDVTREATRAVLATHPELDVGLPLDFEQSMVPKLDADSLHPVGWPAAPALEWCPPGHGDIYGALRRSGLLAALLERGFRYAMISNSDNLGATVDATIAAHLERERIPFLMEVVQGTESDRKSGHIARRRADGQLVLREIAQTPAEDEESFRDFRRWRYYNTNNLWVNLESLSELLEARDGVLALPLIVNRKTVDPRDSSSTPVLQLESAMGAAIGSFPSAALLVVPRSRFVPVKTTNDLLVMRSDVYTVTDDMLVRPLPERDGSLPFVDLDPGFYKLVDQFEQRFPFGAPSLREAERLIVRGDVTFGADIVVRGAVEVEADEPLELAAGTTLGS